MLSHQQKRLMIDNDFPSVCFPINYCPYGYDDDDQVFLEAHDVKDCHQGRRHGHNHHHHHHHHRHHHHHHHVK